MSITDRPKKLNFKALSKSDYYGIIFDYWKGLKPFKANFEFGNEVMEIKFHKTIKSFFNCANNSPFKSYYECHAQAISQSNDTICSIENCFSNRAIQGN